MTPKQREAAVSKAVKALEKAADSLLDLELMAIGIDSSIDTRCEEKFREELRERARYWGNCTWWKK